MSEEGVKARLARIEERQTADSKTLTNIEGLLKEAMPTLARHEESIKWIIRIGGPVCLALVGLKALGG